MLKRCTLFSALVFISVSLIPQMNGLDQMPHAFIIIIIKAINTWNANIITQLQPLLKLLWACCSPAGDLMEKGCLQFCLKWLLSNFSLNDSTIQTFLTVWQKSNIQQTKHTQKHLPNVFGRVQKDTQMLYFDTRLEKKKVPRRLFCRLDCLSSSSLSKLYTFTSFSV